MHALLLIAALAHHSHPYFYDACKSVTIEGRVERVEFKDPHTQIVLRLDDGTAYTVDWAPRSRLTSQGVIGPATEALAFGARISVTGSRIRSTAEIREHFPELQSDVDPNTVDPTSIRRVGNSFNWALPNAPPCTRAGAKPAFEAATIKPVAAGGNPLPVAPAAPNRLRIPRQTLTQLIYTAYGNGGYNTAMSVRGGPDWARTTAFSVEGVAPTKATPQQMRLMLQTLLEDRFALKLRNETETGDVLTLVVDRSDGVLGPGVKKWDGTCPSVMPALVFPAARRPLERVGDTFIVGPPSDTDDPEVPYCPTGYRFGGIRADGATMSTMASLLSLPPARALLGKFTQDRTGLTGRYTMELDYLFSTTPGATASANPADPDLSTAVKEQLGLRLVPGKGPLKVVVVESARLPTTD